MSILEKYKQFFENEVANFIEQIIKNWLKENNSHTCETCKFFNCSTNDYNTCMSNGMSNYVDNPSAKGYTDQEFKDSLRDAKLTNQSENDNELIYTFMSEPYIKVSMNFDNNVYSIIIADQMSIRNKFISEELNTFIQFWNKVVIDYYGENSFPQMPLYN